MTSETYGMGKTPIDYLIDRLQMIGIVDMGVISAYAKSTNRATVELFRVSGDSRQVISGVEVLFMGNNANGLWCECVGSPCLVIYPRSPVVDITKRQINPGKRPYDAAGVKCIPFSTRSRATLDVGFNSMGEFIIQSENYSVTINSQGITYSNADSSVVKGVGDTDSDSQYGRIFTVTNAEQTETYYIDDSKKCTYRFVYKYDGTYTIQRNAYTPWTQQELGDRDSYKKWTWETVWDSTGAFTQTLQDAQQKPLIVMTRGIDGSFEYKQTNTNGDVLNQITVSSTGDVSVSQTKAENTITLTQDGKLTINTKDATSITVGGDCNLSVTGAATIEGAGVTVDGGSGNIAIGNGNYTLKDAFNDLITVLDSFQTAGSPANHTAVPSQFETLKTNLQGLFG